MKRFSVLFLSFLLFVILSISFVFSVQWSSPLRQFNVTPDIVYLNWTNSYTANFTVTINQTFDNVTMEIRNITAVSENYSQSNSETQCTSLYNLFIKDYTDTFTNIIGPLNATNSSSSVLIDNTDYNHRTCKPGRYWIERLTIRNTTQTNETANITVYIDIPISSTNTINNGLLSSGIESFSGSLPVNASTYHSYYFNITELSNGTTNVTGVAINLTGWSSSQDIDIFLFDDSGNLKAKSINKTSTTESLLYNYLPSDSAMWEIRVYGNSTSTIPYSGYLAFTGLNLINNSDDQRLSVLNLGSKNASDLIQLNFKLKNELNLTASAITESKELYHVDKFSGSGSQNFTFFVPGSIVTKVKVSLNWTGGSNYSFNVYNQENTLIDKSANKHTYANVTNSMQEEYNETTNVGNAGTWKLEVRNSTTIANSYDVFVYQYISTSNWFVSNYTSTSLNRIFTDGNYTDIQMNFTVQNTTMNGLYEGYVQYLDNNRAGVRIPISLNVTTPMLVVNNTLSSFTGRVDENYGSDLTKSMNFLLNNTGIYDLSVVMTNSSNTLTCVLSSGCSIGNITNFTFTQISSIPKYSSQILNVNITFNSSLPTGVYEGWIYIYGNNSPVALSSHPYDTFNITVRLNLTSSLNIEFLEIKTASGDNMIRNGSSAENITTRVDIKYVNGTVIEAKNALNTSNFTIWLVNRNITSHRVPSSESLSLYNGSNPIYTDSWKYMINATVPENTPGGIYNVYVTANYIKNISYSGTGINQTLIINNTGLNVTCVSCPASISNGSSVTVNVSVTNYGWVSASLPIITYTKGSYISTVTYLGISSNCGASGTPSSSVTITSIAANGTQTCYVAWTVTAGSSSGSDKSPISVSNAAYFSGVAHYYSVSTPSTTTTTTTATTAASTTATTTRTTTTTVAPSYLEITSYPSTVTLEQGNSTTEWVKVKNAHRNISQSVTLSIVSLNNSWYSIPSPTATIVANGTQSYLVRFNVSIDAEVGDYNAKFNASSSYSTVTKSFVLTVTPSLETKLQINSTIAEYQNQLTLLGTQINKTKDEGYNTSEADQKFNELKSKINSAINYRNSGDYKSAYQTFSNIDTLFNQTRTALNSATAAKKESDWLSWGKWVIIGVVGVVAGFLGYMFWPTPGYKPETGYAPQPKTEFRGKLKERFERLRERWNKIREKKVKTKYYAPSV